MNNTKKGKRCKASIYLEGGAVVEIECESITTTQNAAGAFIKMSWEDADCSILTFDLTKVLAVVGRVV